MKIMSIIFLCFMSLFSFSQVNSIFDLSGFESGLIRSKTLSLSMKKSNYDRILLQEAIDQAIQSNMTLNLGGRAFEIDKELTISAKLGSNFILHGEGANIKIMSETKGILVSKKPFGPAMNIDINGITFDGNFKNTLHKDGLVYISGTNSFSIKNSIIKNSAGNGLRLFYNNKNIMILNNKIDSCEWGGIHIEGHPSIEPFHKDINGIISGNIVTRSQEQNGIFVRGSLRRFIISDNIISYSGDCGIEIGGTESFFNSKEEGWRTKNVLITNNFIDSSSMFDGHTTLNREKSTYKNALWEGASILIRKSHNVILSDNIIDYSRGYGLHIMDGSSKISFSGIIKNVRIAALKLPGGGGHGIQRDINVTMSTKLPKGSRVAYVQSAYNVKLNINELSEGERDVFFEHVQSDYNESLINNSMEGYFRHKPKIKSSKGFLYRISVEDEGRMSNVGSGYILDKSGWDEDGLNVIEYGNYISFSGVKRESKLNLISKDFFKHFGHQQFILEIKYSNFSKSKKEISSRLKVSADKEVLFESEFLSSKKITTLKKIITFPTEKGKRQNLNLSITPSADNSELKIYHARLYYPGTNEYLSLIEGFNPAKTK